MASAETWQTDTWLTFSNARTAMVCASTTVAVASPVYLAITQPTSLIILGSATPTPFADARGPGDFCIAFVLPEGRYDFLPLQPKGQIGEISLINAGSGAVPVQNVTLVAE